MWNGSSFDITLICCFLTIWLKKEEKKTIRATVYLFIISFTVPRDNVIYIKTKALLLQS
jgi:hypothetical protein